VPESLEGFRVSFLYLQKMLALRGISWADAEDDDSEMLDPEVLFELNPKRSKTPKSETPKSETPVKLQEKPKEQPNLTQKAKVKAKRNPKLIQKTIEELKVEPKETETPLVLLGAAFLFYFSRFL